MRGKLTKGAPDAIPRGVKKGVASDGSRLRIQQYIHAHRVTLNAALREHETLDAYLESDPDWRSPVAERDFLEFRDDLWHELELPEPTPTAAGFWPRNGPQWDAVAGLSGRDGTKGVLLIEAKARRGEDRSAIDRRTERTLKLRIASMASVQREVGVRPGTDWTKPRYQLANRLTFLHYLRIQRGVPAWLGLIYFTGDSARSPASALDWRPDIEASFGALGLPVGNPLSGWMIEVILPALDKPDRRQLALAVPADLRSPATSYWAQS